MIYPSVRAWSTVKQRSVVRILWCERLCKLMVGQPAITVLIVPLKEQVDVIKSHMDTDVSQTVLDVEWGDHT